MLKHLCTSARPAFQIRNKQEITAETQTPLYAQLESPFAQTVKVLHRPECFAAQTIISPAQSQNTLFLILLRYTWTSVFQKRKSLPTYSLTGSPSNFRFPKEQEKLTLVSVQNLSPCLSVLTLHRTSINVKNS